MTISRYVLSFRIMTWSIPVYVIFRGVLRIYSDAKNGVTVRKPLVMFVVICGRMMYCIKIKI